MTLTLMMAGGRLTSMSPLATCQAALDVLTNENAVSAELFQAPSLHLRGIPISTWTTHLRLAQLTFVCPTSNGVASVHSLSVW